MSFRYDSYLSLIDRIPHELHFCFKGTHSPGDVVTKAIQHEKISQLFAALLDDGSVLGAMPGTILKKNFTREAAILLQVADLSWDYSFAEGIPLAEKHINRYLDIKKYEEKQKDQDNSLQKKHVALIHKRPHEESDFSQKSKNGEKQENSSFQKKLKKEEQEKPEPFKISFSPAWNSKELPIIGRKESVSNFLKENYGGNTSQSQKYISRLGSISKYFRKDSIYPARGDGNCFCNAALVGIIARACSSSQIKELVTRVICSGMDNSLLYVLPDSTKTAPTYSKDFNKKEDFNLVLEKWLQTDLSFPDLLEDHVFTSTFARVLRYLMRCKLKDENNEFIDVSAESGQEVDMNAVLLLNDMFNLNVAMVVLEAPKGNREADPDDPYAAYVIKGRDLWTSTATIKLNDSNNEKPFDFLLIRKSGHFIALM